MAPDQQHQLPKRWAKGANRGTGSAVAPTNCINSLGCGLSSFRETVHLTIGPPARTRELRRHAQTLCLPYALQAADSAAAFLCRPTANPRANGSRLSRPAAPLCSRFLGNCG